MLDVAGRGVREQILHYSEEASSLHKPSTEYSMVQVAPLHQGWIGLGCKAQLKEAFLKLLVLTIGLKEGHLF